MLGIWQLGGLFGKPSETKPTGHVALRSLFVLGRRCREPKCSHEINTFRVTRVLSSSKVATRRV